MEDLYAQMIACLNQKIACLSPKEKAAIFAWLQALTGDPCVVGVDQRLDGRMHAWLAQHDLVESIMWYRFILNRWPGEEDPSAFSELGTGSGLDRDG